MIRARGCLVGGGAPLWVVAAALLAGVLAAACGVDGESARQDAGAVSATQIVIPTQIAGGENELPSYIRRGWRTDFGRLVVPAGEIVAGGAPRDGIAAIDEPSFVGVADARDILDDEPVVVVEIEGDARAYPLGVMMRHEVVNDVVGGIDVAVTYCPLCNSAVAFRREVDGRTLDFGVTGNLRFSDLLMWDRQTESWWQQIGGEAIGGELAGRRLEVVPAAVVAWGEFRRAHPNGKALVGDAGSGIDYGAAAYWRRADGC